MARKKKADTTIDGGANGSVSEVQINRVSDILATTGAEDGKAAFVVPDLEIDELKVPIIGMTGLMTHAWSAKALKEIRDKQGQKARQKKAKKEPYKEFIDSLYIFEGPPRWFGIPALAFKKAVVEACRFTGDVMTQTWGAFHVIEDGVIARAQEVELDLPDDAFEVVLESVQEVCRIYGDKPRLREDTVRVGPQKTADLRYRGYFQRWACIVRFQYNKRVISPEQLINLVRNAGFSNGVGEWRPSRHGNMGRFRVATDLRELLDFGVPADQLGL
jgi:hypothetical protein